MWDTRIRINKEKDKQCPINPGMSIIGKEKIK
jgi:hypothetical protein